MGFFYTFKPEAEISDRPRDSRCSPLLKTVTFWTGDKTGLKNMGLERWFSGHEHWCCFRWPRFDSQHQHPHSASNHLWLQFQETYPIPSSDLYGHTYTQISKYIFLKKKERKIMTISTKLIPKSKDMGQGEAQWGLSSSWQLDCDLQGHTWQEKKTNSTSCPPINVCATPQVCAQIGKAVINKSKI